jgi:Serine/threonine protein kinase
MTNNQDSVFISVFQSVKSNSDSWYRVLKFLGKGGNGTAYLVSCTDGKFKGSFFTLKVFHMISSEVRKQRFLGEIELMKSYHHPNILQQYDEGTWNGYPFVIMDYMPYSMNVEIAHETITIEDALRYSLQLLSALKALHSLGYIHRDIKPGNIYVKSHNAVLGDLGLIKKVALNNDEVEEDIEGYIAMPKYYRTPDLVEYAKNGTALTESSDVFQLGLVLCDIFVGINPLKPTENLLEDIKLKPVPVPKGKYGGRIHFILLKMIARDKEKRITVDRALDLFNKIHEDYLKDIINIQGDILYA